MHFAYTFKLWAGWEFKKIKVNCTFITFNSLLLRSNGQYPFTKKKPKSKSRREESESFFPFFQVSQEFL